MDATRTEQYKCQSYSVAGRIQNCSCGKCLGGTVEPYTKIIDCPDCASAAKLYIYGSIWAGIWECENPECGASDSCEHASYHAEDTETMYFDSYGFPASRSSEISICDECEVQVNVENYDYVR